MVTRHPIGTWIAIAIVSGCVSVPHRGASLRFTRRRYVPTHAQKEFAWLGTNLYRREEIDGLAPYKVIRVAAARANPQLTSRISLTGANN